MMLRTIPRLAVYGALGAWALVCLFPLYWVVVTSLKQTQDIVNGPVYLPFIDFKPTLRSWIYILFNPDDDTLRRFGNSLVVATVATGLTIALGGTAAYGLARLQLNFSARAVAIAFAVAALCWVAVNGVLGSKYGLPTALSLFAVVLLGSHRPRQSLISNDQIALFILGTRILPPVAIALPIYLMAQTFGLLDSWTALIMVYAATNLPLAIWLLRDVVEAIPKDLEEAAELDGASRFRILLTVTFPLARIGVVAVAVLTFVFCWNEYTFSIFLTTDHALTMPPFLAGQMATREQMASAEPEWGYFTVLITMMVAPLVVFAGLLQRLLARAFVGVLN